MTFNNNVIKHIIYNWIYENTVSGYSVGEIQIFLRERNLLKYQQSVF